jgi:hypothetical protein
LLRIPRGGGSAISRTMLAGLADRKNNRSAN